MALRVRDLLRRFRRELPPFVEGNRIQILVDGGAYFDELLRTIEGARKYLFLEFYIVAEDDTGWRVAKALAARAQAGVEVAFCYDWYGSMSSGNEMLEYMAAAGVKILPWGLPSFSRKVPFSRRNHRKLVVADGAIGLVGGMNLTREYDAKERGGANWRDTAVRIEGPAVAHLEPLFRLLWRKEKGPPLSSTAIQVDPFPGGEPVRYLANYARRDRSFIRRAYLLSILNAQKSIRIMNAYFIPDRVMRRALIRAAKRGVRVEVIVAGVTDVAMAKIAARALYTRLMVNNVDIYEYQGRVLHAKTAVIDGVWTTIGSSNLDYLSNFVLLEVNASVLGERIGSAMDDQFEVDKSNSKRVSPEMWLARPWEQRFFEWFFRLFMRWY